MLAVFLLLSLASFVAPGHGCAPEEEQVAATATGSPLEHYITSSSIQTPAPMPWRSTSQQMTPVVTVSVLAQPPSVPPTVACWATPFCNSIITDFASCYNLTGNITNPNADDGRSEIYQRCLCSDKGTMYKYIITNDESDNVGRCWECMKQAGVDTDDRDQPMNQVKWKIHDFCNTAAPNLYDLLASFLAWLKSTNEPVDNETQLGGIPAVSTLASRFTSTSGMNQRTRITSMPKSMQGPWPWPWPTSTTSNAITTQFLQRQLPEDWPYMGYGVARKTGKTNSFPLTDPSSMNVTVAWLYHKLAWNPRPLFTPRPARKEIYQPALQNWTRAMSNGDVLNMIIHASTTTTSSSTSSSTDAPDPIATPALASQILSSFPGLTTTSSTSTVTISVTAVLTLPTSTFPLIPIPLTALSSGVREKRLAVAMEDLWEEIERARRQLSGECRN